MSRGSAHSSTRQWILHHGEALAWLRSLPDGYADALITDPPYSSGGAFRGDRAVDPSQKYEQSGQALRRDTFSGDVKDQRVWERWTREWLTEARRVCRSGAVLCVFIDWRQLPAMTDAVQMADWCWRGIAVWDKTEGARASGVGRFRHQAEYIVWGSNGPLPVGHVPRVLPGVFRQVVRQADKHHLAGKPTEVMRWLCGFVPEGGLVLDPFAGSGTTGVAALQEGLRFAGCERESEYVKIARARLRTAPPPAHPPAEAHP